MQPGRTLAGAGRRETGLYAQRRTAQQRTLLATGPLDAGSVANRDLLEAFWHLAYYRESPSTSTRRVNYAALDVEELGSAYESLLDYHPQIEASDSPRRFELGYGSERKATGAYYTPPEPVAELIRSALEAVIAERFNWARQVAEELQRVASGELCTMTSANEKGKPMPIQSYRDLVVWQKAMDLGELTYRLTREFPKDELHGLTSQMRRAATLVPANIAEGWARRGTKEFLRFLNIAAGSLRELET